MVAQKWNRLQHLYGSIEQAARNYLFISNNNKKEAGLGSWGRQDSMADVDEASVKGIVSCCFDDTGRELEERRLPFIRRHIQ